MTRPALAQQEERLISTLVSEFKNEMSSINTFLNAFKDALEKSRDLSPLIHSLRFRIKDPDSLADKLRRNFLKCKDQNAPFDINEENLFEKINDLAGARILHLHTEQIVEIDSYLKNLFENEDFNLKEGPIAKVWDMESKEFFNGHDIETENRTEDLYTSVHYVIGRKGKTCEIQVRTLSEEIWGAVSHRVNYPIEADSLACREQMKVLAKITSCTTRQVDAIFRIYKEHECSEGLAAERKFSP